MLVTELGIVTEGSVTQLLKAQFPMLFTELGMVTEVRWVQAPYLQLTVCQLVLIKTVEK